MDQSGAVTDKAKELNAPPNAWASSAERAARQDERRMLMGYLPSERILDDEHMADLVEHVASWAPDIVRQAALRKAGSGQLRGRILRPDEYDALLAQVRAAKM